VIALRGYINERSEFLMTTLPVSTLTSDINPVVLPQFADGGGWSTQVILTNPTDAPLYGVVQFYGSGSNTQSAPLLTLSINGNMTSTFEYTIPPHSEIRLVTGNTGTTVQDGSVRVIPTGSVAPTALCVFSFQNNGITVTEAGVSAIPSGLTFQVYAESVGGLTDIGSIQSGLAMASLISYPVNVTLQLSGLDGTPSASPVTLTIPAGGQIAKFVKELFPTVQSGFRGLLTLSANAPIGVTGLRLRYNARGDLLLTTTPARSMDAPSATPEIVFPHVVSGGGFTTQFIIYGQSGSGDFWLNSQDGISSSSSALQQLQ
jgi:hypothetical protein